MGLSDQASNGGTAAPAAGRAPDSPAAGWVPSGGSYLTDGTALFCVAQTLSDTTSGELFLELENCGTLDVVLCPVGSVREVGLRPVAPALGVPGSIAPPRP